LTDTTAERGARVLTDEEMLARFHNSRRVPTSSQLLGFKVRSLSQAEKMVEIGFDADFSRMCNTMGQIQGGFLSAMLDECMSVACTVASGMTAFAPTLEMKVSFLRAATKGPLRGVGRVIKWGRTIAFTEGELFDDEGRLLAKATGTAMPAQIANFRK
jgi:uncharacterized protein (TIGR00369 family)